MSTEHAVPGVSLLDRPQYERRARRDASNHARYGAGVQADDGSPDCLEKRYGKLPSFSAPKTGILGRM